MSSAASSPQPDPASGYTAAAHLNAFTTSKNKYELLGVEPDAPPEVIKRAYRRMAFLYHPDRHPAEEKAQAEEIFRRISRAYATLSDPSLRQRYDELVRRGMEDAEVGDAPASEGVSLGQILANLYEYEHVFAEEDLKKLSNDLFNIVIQNLIKEIHEEVIAVVPIKGAPTNVPHEGSFVSGGMVITTVRVLLPFHTKWETQHSGYKTIHQRLYMPVFAFPNLRKLTVVSQGRMKPRTRVEFRSEERSSEVRSKYVDLTKLLLVCNIWGVPVEGIELPDAGREWRRVILWYPIWVSLAACLAFALFGDGTTAGHALILAFSVTFAIGFARAWKASHGATMQTLLRTPPPSSAQPEPPTTTAPSTAAQV